MSLRWVSTEGAAVDHLSVYERRQGRQGSPIEVTTACGRAQILEPSAPDELRRACGKCIEQLSHQLREGGVRA